MVGLFVGCWLVVEWGGFVGWWFGWLVCWLVVGRLVEWLVGLLVGGEVRPRGGGWVEDRHLDCISLSATSTTVSNGFWHKMFSFPPTKHKN